MVHEGVVMGLWLLSFTEREVAVIVEAETLAHARLLAAANQVCRASLFDEGWAIRALPEKKESEGIPLRARIGFRIVLEGRPVRNGQAVFGGSACTGSSGGAGWCDNL